MTEYTQHRIFQEMDAVKVYACLCDETRLRILNLLLEGPLCVCHLVEILGESQPKISRHLRALRECGAVATERCYNWTICRVPGETGPVLEANLRCLRDLRREEAVLAADLEKRARMMETISSTSCEDLPAKIRILAASCG